MFGLRSILLTVLALPLCAQRQAGDLRLTVHDPAGLGVEAEVTLTGDSTQVHRAFRTDRQGQYVAKSLPFGPYRLDVQKSGFAPARRAVQIQSELPVDVSVTIGVAAVETTMVVTDNSTLLDPQRTGPAQYIGAEAIRDGAGSRPARAVLDLVQSQPGWILEANGVLHPRGSEYQTQFVVDGVPVQDNRSPGYAPGLEADEVQSLTVMTGNYPAEYGRKLGGVVEVSSVQDQRPGFHGKLSLEDGSFATREGALSAQYMLGRTTFGMNTEGSRTDRFLDPPSEDNFLNRGFSEGVGAKADRDLGQADRLRLAVHSRRSRFTVPNDPEQQAAGQRQDRASDETSGQAAYQHVFSPRLMASVHAMARDLSATLFSNALATPVIANQDRGFREAYTGGSVVNQRGSHEIKAGGDFVWTSVREAFNYQITNPDFFDQGILPAFRFAAKKPAYQASGFVQDQMHWKNLSVSAGVRFDSYRFLIHETAWSPRLGAAYSFPSIGLVVRASYDRAFQTPAIENLLLASADVTSRLSQSGTQVVVRPSRGNFYQAGFSKSLFARLRLDGTAFKRSVRDFADDDVLLNTGVSFPITFSQAQIHGIEAKVEVPTWGRFSGFVSYSNQTGTGYLPVTGGLFLDPGSAAQLLAHSAFAITQDQRNTVSARVHVQVLKRLDFAVGSFYGSGLPVDASDPLDMLRRSYTERVLSRVNFNRGRVRPSFGVNASAGVDLWKSDRRSARFQVDGGNLTDRLNVINFAGLLSGTAIGPPRSVSGRFSMSF